MRVFCKNTLPYTAQTALSVAVQGPTTESSFPPKLELTIINYLTAKINSIADTLCFSSIPSVQRGYYERCVRPILISTGGDASRWSWAGHRSVKESEEKRIAIQSME